MTDGMDPLDLSVRSVASAPVERIDGDASVRDAADRLSTGEVGSLLVDGAVGILTEADVVASVSAGRDPERTPVRVVMSAPVVTVSTDATVREAVERMTDRGVKKLPVTDEGEVVGMVTTTDVTAALVPDLEDVLDLLADE